MVQKVRKLTAVMLLFYVGMMIPASAAPMRFCLLEMRLSSTQGESKCCADCTQESEQPDPCCLDLKELPDALVPQLPAELPAAVILDIPFSISPSVVLSAANSGGFSLTKPIRGPTSPVACQARLGIWRL